MQKILKFDNFCILQEENASVIVDGSTGIISTADSTVKSHDSSDSTVDFLCGFFFVSFYIACRVGTDIDVIHHPAEYRMPTVDQLLLQRQFHECLGRWGHILKALTERNNGKAHSKRLRLLLWLRSQHAIWHLYREADLWLGGA